MRKNFITNWAFGITETVAKIVRDNFPQYLRLWPFIQIFDLKTYKIKESYAIFIFKDIFGITNVPHISDIFIEFPFKDHPNLPPKVSEIELWQFYLQDKFNLPKEDSAFIIPIHDSGINVSEDFKLFSIEEQHFWHEQISYIIGRYKSYMDSSMDKKTEQTNIYNVSGINTRLNIGSNDSSVNIAETKQKEVFDQLKEVLSQIESESDKKNIEDSIKTMESSYGTENFVKAYQNFMSFIANHITVFAPILPALSKLLS